MSDVRFVTGWTEWNKDLCHRKHEDGLPCQFSFHYEVWINIWVNSSHSAKIFKIHRNIIRIITGCM